MQTLVRIVAAFVVLVLLLLVALPLQLINMLAANEPANESANDGKPADDLESEPVGVRRLEPPPHPLETQPRIRGEAINSR